MWNSTESLNGKKLDDRIETNEFFEDKITPIWNPGLFPLEFVYKDNSVLSENWVSIPAEVALKIITEVVFS